MAKVLVQLVAMMLPWSLRRRLLQSAFGYRIHPTARIGACLVLAQKLEMGPGAQIRHLTVIRGVERVNMATGASIGRANWIYAIPPGSPFLMHEPNRRPELLIGTGGGMGNRHLVDCSNTVSIGDYSGLVGYGTQVLTHQIDVRHYCQSTKPITIGKFCMVGTRSVLLGGATLPDRSMLGAGSTLRTAFTEPQQIYSGVPAVPTGVWLPDDASFFDPTLRDDARSARQTAL
jgi:acetyltransferase-like isoleucine patch superfamily enzyme